MGQGKVRAKDHFKAFINPCLETLEESEFGIWLGDICISVSGVADDIYLLSDDPKKLQCLIDLVVSFGHK